jgi:hypothetical protein
MEFLGLILLVAPLGALIFYVRQKDRQDGRKPTLDLRDLFARAAPPPEVKTAPAAPEPEPEAAKPEIRFKLG